MAKVKTPAGETVEVKRRWFPWPHFAHTEKLQKLGVPAKLAVFLGKSHVGDWVALALALLLGLLVSQISEIIALVLVGLALAAGMVWFFALPWQIEVFHRGRRVDSENYDGYSASKLRINKLAALYESGALKPPNPVLPAPPDATLTIPPIAHKPKEPLMRRPRILSVRSTPTEAEAPEEPALPEALPLDDDFQGHDEGAFFVSDEPLFGDESTEGVFPGSRAARVDAGPAPEGETILRKAVRQVEAEQKVLKQAGLVQDLADPSVVKRASKHKKGRSAKR